MFTNFDLIGHNMTTDLTAAKQILSMPLIVVFRFTAHAQYLYALPQNTVYATSKYIKDVIIAESGNITIIPADLPISSKFEQVKIAPIRGQFGIHEKQALELGLYVDL